MILITGGGGRAWQGPPSPGTHAPLPATHAPPPAMHSPPTCHTCPPSPWILRDAVNERAVCILLECTLVGDLLALADELYINFLLPANKVCEGYVFTPVCQRFCSQGVCLLQCMLGYTPHQSRHSPSGANTPRADTQPMSIHPPPCAVHAGRYGQQAGGTHPTGMHTCLRYIFTNGHYELLVHSIFSRQLSQYSLL